MPQDRKIKLLIVSSYAILITLILKLYSGRSLLFGGEGNYFLDYETVTPLYRSAWFPLGGGLGAPNPLLHQTFLLFDLFSFLQKIGVSSEALNLLTISFLFIAPFAAMLYLTSSVLKMKLSSSTLVSLFYVLNPFFIVQMNFMMIWNLLPFTTIPIAFSIMYRYFDNRVKLFTYFGIFTLVFSSSFENIPYLGIFHISLPISIILITLLKSKALGLTSFINGLKKYLIVLVGFVLFNMWWFLPLLRFQVQDLANGYSSQEASQYVIKNAIGSGPIMHKVITFTTMISTDSEYFYSQFYENPLVHIFMLIPIGLVIYSFYQGDRSKRDSLFISSTTLFLLIIFFLNKGANNPFGYVYLFLLDYVPLFLLFKTPLEKFAVLATFLTSLILVFGINTRFYPKVLLAMYILICSIPIIQLKFFPEYKIATQKYVTHRYIDKSEYKEVRNLINESDPNSRVMSLPGSLNYQVTLHNNSNNYYRGLDPILFNINKPFMATYFNNSSDILFDNISHNAFPHMLGLYAVDTIHLNRDMYLSFGKRERETLNQIDRLLSAFMNRAQIGNQTIFELPQRTGRIYIPKYIVNTEVDRTYMPTVIESNHEIIREKFAIRFDMPSISGNVVNIQPLVPQFQYKSVNPSLFVAEVFGQSQPYTIVFSESYHPQWKAYIIDRTDFTNDSKENFLSYIRFVFNKQKIAVADSEHSIINGYANSWNIDPDMLCNTNQCHQLLNSNKYSIVFEFKPQRLFFFGSLVTITTAIVSLWVVLFRK